MTLIGFSENTLLSIGLLQLPALVVTELLMRFELSLQNITKTVFQKIFRRPAAGYETIAEDGLPIIVYPDIGIHRHPLFVLRYVQKLLSSKEVPANKIRFALTELDKYLLKDGDSLIVIHDFDRPQFGLKAPWTSGLDQMVAAETYATAAKALFDNEYLSKANQLFHGFCELKHHFITEIQPGVIWYEEFPGADKEHHYSLNAMMSCVISLYNYQLLTEDENASSLFETGLKSLCLMLPKYNRCLISTYNLRGLMAGITYQELHVVLLRKIYGFTRNPIIRRYAKIWQFGRMLPVCFQLQMGWQPRRTMFYLFVYFLVLAVMIILPISF